MQTRDLPAELLLPPKRLGALLAEARVDGGYSLTEAADALGETWSPLTLLEVETGRRPVMDPEVKSLTELYGIPTTTLIPERSHLVVDLTEGTLAAGDRTVRFESATVERREVLAQYLAMVYAMRDVRPGTAVPLREPDLEILEGVLEVPRRNVESELHSLMLSPDGPVAHRMGRLRGRLLIPVIGVVVAVTAAGTLLLVSGDSDASVVTTTGDTESVETPAGAEPGADAPASDEVEIGDAVVQERLPDGSPGPVVTRD
ncbi:MAG: helix-turn-helix domain-containing protein [Actinomycetota bacterium]|nr:helix-turn-helix domain-containing protein [Actinomycetota bacterium]